MCVKKSRWLAKDDRYVRYGLMAYHKFMDISYPFKKRQSHREFIDSSVYNDFVNFGQYLIELNAVNPMGFVEFLVKMQVPISKWKHHFVYEQYIRELTKKETARAAVERNILLFEQWAMKHGTKWNDFFRVIQPAEAVLMIRMGRLSPWVLYLAESATELISKLSDEQFKLIETYVDPIFWNVKFKQDEEETEFIREVLKDAGL